MPRRPLLPLAALALAILALTAVALRSHAAAPAATEAVPDGWLLAGAAPNDYAATIDRTQAHTGKGSALLQSSAELPSGFGTLMQTFKGELYRDDRLRLSAWIKTENVANACGLWMRVDGQLPNQVLAFDNMHTRPIRGTTRWKKYEVVLDVSQDAKDIAFGVLLDGPGRVWIDDIQFEKVDTTVPTTGETTSQDFPDSPRNLGFE